MAPRSKAKALSNPSQSQKQPKLQFADIDIQTIITEQLESQESCKRKDSPFSEEVTLSGSSDVERASPCKKKRQSPPAQLGSEDFDLVSAPSNENEGELAESESISAVVAVSPMSRSPGRPKRKIFKTAKAKAMMEMKEGDAHEVCNLPAKTSVAGNRKVAKTPQNLISDDEDYNKTVSESRPDEDLDEVLGGAVAAQSGHSFFKSSTPSYESLISVKPADTVESDEEGLKFPDELGVFDVGSKESRAPDVMLSPCPDPELSRLYENLPSLPRLCEVKPFNGSTDSPRTTFAAACDGLRPEDVKALVQALAFTKSGFFVNTARIDPSELLVENSRLRLRETKNLAICIMTGTLTESFIETHAEAGPRASPYAIHKITIAPFEQDWRRDVSVWGLLFGFHIIAGMMSPAGFGFATRGEGKGDAWRPQSTNPSPIKGLSKLKTVSSPLLAVPQDSIYQSSKSYDDPIPVYDGRAVKGRAAFRFTDSDFRKLTSWPRYRCSSGEVPVGSIVSVGYTLSTYSGNLGPVLSSNIQFIILLASS